MSFIISPILFVVAIGLFIILYHTNTFDTYVKKITIQSGLLFSQIKEKLDNIVHNLKTKKEELKKTQLTYHDSLNILNFLKMKYTYDSILIPKILSYENENNTIIFKNMEIIGIQSGLHNDPNIVETHHTITLKFIPINNDTFISEYNLFGINGNFYCESGTVNDKGNSANESVFDLIPDIIHLSSNNDEEIDKDTVVNTTESIIDRASNKSCNAELIPHHSKKGVSF